MAPDDAEEAARDALTRRRNWGRWGSDDQRGAFNLITCDSIVRAARLVQTGVRVSLSRPFPTEEGSGNHDAVVHRTWKRSLEDGHGAGESGDAVTATWHSPLMTHLDALCHLWGDEGMWNGRDPEVEIDAGGSRWGGVEQWREGFVTRGVLLDVPRFRGERYVRQDRPVLGSELRQIAESSGCVPGPGDAVVVYSGLAAYEEENGPPKPDLRPGLHASCMEAIRDWDVSLVVWDMQDLTPSGLDAAPWSVHGVLYAYGVGLVDAVVLEPLVEACDRQNRREFLLLVLPLHIRGGTASAVNPVAVF